MKVNNYQIGKYHAIIKKIYEDDSINYETSFFSEADLVESAVAISQCVGELVGIATDNPKVLKSYTVIRGKEEIIKELK